MSDAHTAEVTEAGGDAIDFAIFCDNAFDEGPRLLDTYFGFCPKLYRGEVTGNGYDFGRGEGLAVENQGSAL
uniref:Uncharacterized protein n=1 Tax=Thermogemmatispora argillosa TaxID=2045280 RepID=A0A455T4H0_9CHLR|nr:hypothetical protein KTA_23400 [Thermogemmatispora argillosa]